MSRIKIILLGLFLLLVGGGVYFGRLFFSSSPVSGEPLSLREEKKFQLLKELDKAGIKVSRLPRWDKQVQAVTVTINGGIKVLFSLEKDFSDQAASLQLILKKSTMLEREKPIKVIDLRGNSPYVSF